MILHQASETSAETPDTAEEPTATEGEAPGHNQHPLSVPSYTIFLQRTFLPISNLFSNLSLVSTHFLQRMQSPVSVTAPSSKPSFSGITVKLGWSSTLPPFKSFTLLSFAFWSGNKHKILVYLLIKTKLKRKLPWSPVLQHLIIPQAVRWN